METSVGEKEQKKYKIHQGQGKCGSEVIRCALCVAPHEFWHVGLYNVPRVGQLSLSSGSWLPSEPELPCSTCVALRHV